MAKISWSRFPRQEYWSGLPFPSPGDLPDPGIEPLSPALARGFFTAEPTRKDKTMFRCKLPPSYLRHGTPASPLKYSL